MSAKRKERKVTVKEPRRGKNDKIDGPDDASRKAQEKAAVVADHLPPFPLVVTILLCSGVMFVLGMRDLLATGKIILGESDAAYMVCSFVGSGVSNFNGVQSETRACFGITDNSRLLSPPCRNLPSRWNGSKISRDGSRLREDSVLFSQ